VRSAREEVVAVSPQRTPTVTSEDINRIACREFPSDSFRILGILREYGVEEWHREANRVRLAVLKLAAGDVDRLRSAIETAKQDYRDVLSAAEYPEYSRSIGSTASVSEAERERIIDADWKQYTEWLAL